MNDASLESGEPLNSAGVVGVLGGIGTSRLTRVARISRNGTLTLAPSRDGDIELGWAVGADDRWRFAADEPAVRQTRPGAAPAYETAMRIPKGDAIQRVYAVSGAPDLVVVDVENASPAPFVAAWVLRGDLRGLTFGDGVLSVAGRPVVVLGRAPARWAIGAVAGEAIEHVRNGLAVEGSLPATAAAGAFDAAREIVLLYPVAHRTRIRLAMLLSDDAAHTTIPSVAALRSFDEVSNGWSAMLDRGMRVASPDPNFMQLIDAARADALLEAAGGAHDPSLFMALEDWGFDDEARHVWRSLSWRARRAASRERGSSSAMSVLSVIRAALLRELPDGSIDLLPDPVAANAYYGIEVHDIETRHGRVSFAVRWHGDRPALLWECPPGMTVRATALDPTWSSPAARGDALLQSVPLPILQSGGITDQGA